MNCSDFEDSYRAGDVCEQGLNWFHYHYEYESFPAEVYGSFYFADIEDGDDEFGQNVTVREYFYRGGGNADEDYEMSRFSINNEGLGAKGNDDSISTHYVFYPAAQFSEGSKEGEKLYVVYDVEDSLSGQTKMRNYYEFTWSEEDDEYFEELIKQKALERRPRPNPLYEEDMPSVTQKL